MSNPRSVPLLFLDLDGTVRQGKDDPLGKFVNGPDDVIVFPEAAERMSAWKENGGRIVGVTNQGGVALGYVSMQSCLDALDETRRQSGFAFDEIMMCPHDPSGHCWCRKPLPGMIYASICELIKRHPGEEYPRGLAIMVGDRPEDEECASRAGIRFFPAAEWRKS